MTERMTREQAEAYATIWGERPDGIVQIATDYIALLDECERLKTDLEAQKAHVNGENEAQK